jgi:hypothetical protein
VKFTYHKVIKSYFICYTRREENMVVIFKFIYTLFLFLSLFFIAMNVDGKKFTSLLHSFIQNILSRFSNIILLSFNLFIFWQILFNFFIAAFNGCLNDLDCKGRGKCSSECIMKCIDYNCQCIGFNLWTNSTSTRR